MSMALRSATMPTKSKHILQVCALCGMQDGWKTMAYERPGHYRPAESQGDRRGKSQHSDSKRQSSQAGAPERSQAASHSRESRQHRSSSTRQPGPSGPRDAHKGHSAHVAHGRSSETSRSRANERHSDGSSGRAQQRTHAQGANRSRSTAASAHTDRARRDASSSRTERSRGNRPGSHVSQAANPGHHAHSSRQSGVNNQYGRSTWDRVRAHLTSSASDSSDRAAAPAGQRAPRPAERADGDRRSQDAHRQPSKEKSSAGFALLSADAPEWFRSSAAANKVFSRVEEARRWNAFRIALVVIVAILAVYLGGVLHYSNHFYDATTVGPVDISGMTEDAAAGALERGASDYELVVTGKSGSFTLKGEQAGLALNTQVIAANAMKLNNPWAWPLCILFPQDYSSALSASVDTHQLNEAVSQEVDSYNKNATAPVNATIVYDKNASKFVIKNEREGDTLNLDQVTKDVTGAIRELATTLTLSDDDYESPSVRSTSDNLKKARSNAGTILKADLQFQIKGQTVAGITGINAASWVTTDDDGNLAFNQDDVSDWVSKTADKYTTVNSERTYTRPDGATFTVSGGDYGWDVDEDSLRSTVQDKLMSGAVETMDLPMTQTADVYNPETGVDWDSYIDVDIDKQHATYYDEDGSVRWESDVVTGAPGGDTDTPTGVYYINNKESPSVLNGFNLETGKKKYSTEVQYWMPWEDNTIGFHDAVWQSAFGGTRYKDGYGSNGCVNLPPDKAKDLYNLVSIGTVVVSHG